MRLDAVKRQVARLRGSGKDSARPQAQAGIWQKLNCNKTVTNTAAKTRTAAKKRGKGPEESGMDAQHYLCVQFSIGNLPTVHVVRLQTMILDEALSRTSPHSI
jgi:hypothetical protein